jgi:hypothetical protein
VKDSLEIQKLLKRNKDAFDLSNTKLKGTNIKRFDENEVVTRQVITISDE